MPSIFIVANDEHSTASTDIATSAVVSGARLITHLFNAMPQLHHRDPCIIGLLGASPHLSVPSSPSKTSFTSAPRSPTTSTPRRIAAADGGPKATSEAFDDLLTPPLTPVLAAVDSELRLKKGSTIEMAFERPFYELIVDGIHSHPNSVRVSLLVLVLSRVH